jgi:NAD+ diphosphatase
LIFFDNLRPLVDVSENKLFSLDYSNVGSQNREIIDSWIKGNADRDSSLLQSPYIHFLGLDTTRHSPFRYREYKGTPYFAIEVGNHPTFQLRINAENFKPLATREEINIHLDYEESSIFAQAKMYLEWITTTPYCRGCGSKTIPINAGSELLCLSESRQSCPVKSAPVSNASFPRLDPVLITCVMNASRDKVLFTRLPKFPKGMYTHIAGFIEPGETIEEAVSREVWEESGLTVSHVSIVRSQPWPYPVNIMIGCVAIVQDGQMDLGHDMELEEAFWCELSTLRRIVEEGKEDENLTVFVPDLPYGIPNDKTLATKLYQYVVDKYA